MKKIYINFFDKKEKHIYKYIKKIFSYIKYILFKEKIYNYILNYIYCNNKYIIYINNIFFKKKKKTDVISLFYNNNNNNIKYLIGEIYICLEETYINSVYNFVDYKYEILRNIIHGTLHTIGYLDNNKKNKEIMYEKQKYYILKYIFKKLIDKVDKLCMI
ncbi:MAG: rRNA maturation RNase YbeY [Candidatus Shikimatogenerans sp. Tcar]|uniref:rRNA maturation RNase YbeY n=1 Tax=Candidatus Shikimatogenerans sp. Tcar TaxID=3158565 RepID=A0AAU7QUD1_9FLAO